MAILLLHEGTRSPMFITLPALRARPSVVGWWYRDEGIDALEALPAGHYPSLTYRQDCHLALVAAHAVFSKIFGYPAQPLVY